MTTAGRSAGAFDAAPRFTKISENDDASCLYAMHQGQGTIDVHRYSFFDERQTPYFVVFDIPPRSSEGIHSHGAENVAEAWLDEYYYIVSGTGIMQIDGADVAVTQGDFIYTPAGVSHGIENTAESGNLKVMLIITSAQPR